ncbi:phosphotransferase [Streptomyces tsukubensis]|uniref:Aminoglycoside phosphotransferase n=1 Tax=Streptomyces tsukubensis TaxID=83656 RepID=A0A1V4A5T0_9ACTN|nr:phosphotransferase [Streptomyces tsukubensis]OON75975.1 aminoglycoside phosphotransferase [Streptomyces tsukubensis]QFR94067.1 phosphotransferase [Streptomyces tsukubensis]
MDDSLTDALLEELCAHIGRPTDPAREELRAWVMSGVERLVFPGGETMIFKYAEKPFAKEAEALRAAYEDGLPVPGVIVSVVRKRRLGVLMEDLGEPVRAPTEREGIAMAVALHRLPVLPRLAVLHEGGLQRLPERALWHFDRLHEVGRWRGTDDIGASLGRVQRASTTRASGAMIPPYGWVHSEFQPETIHVGAGGPKLLDFARSYTGPALFDLATWHGIRKAEPARMRGLLEAYVAAGGAPEALRPRGGLSAEAWALGWQRMWGVEWFLEQAGRWVEDPAQDPVYIEAVRHHLRAVMELFQI